MSESRSVPKLNAYLYPVLAGCCIFLSFETYNFVPLLLLLPFFLNGMRELPLKNKLLGYWLMSIVMNMGGYHWISMVARDYGGLPVIASWGLVLFFSLFNNLNFMLWAYLERFFGEKSSPFIIAAIFVVTERINPQVFPWYFGTCLDSTLVLYQTADLFGVSGLSFIAMALIHMPWWIWQHRKTLWSTHKMAFMRQLGFLVFIVTYGIGALNNYGNEPAPDKKSVGITLVQSNTTMEKFYGAHLSREERWQEFQNIVRLTEKAIEQHPDTTDLVVWPEGSVHFPILNYPAVFNEIANLARRHGVYVTAGSVELGGTHPSGRRIYHNTQFVLNPEGEIVGKYRKIVLLAFGEYIPFLDTFPFLADWLPESISHFTRGTKKPVFALGEDVHWLPLICYEDIISGFMRGFDHREADFIVNITNDGWFGKSDASHLHKQMARPRAVEYRKPMVRTLNTGSSQVIDAAGRTISKETDLYVQDFINATLHLPQEPPVTLYARIGNWPVYILIAVVALLWVRRFFLNVKNGDN
ncbi:apolipoprotein N-acyltransferase [candidate division KSB1 bacterium]|nr:apolipoprotein N-acyltransferase [candidate division KSB1 bacterium]NIR72373.1 apolipoprotein N-acyltransferase [candidate division KSB1 bacterium]NIS23559.1 apolipoprotein N-acyltransferase [candidate division KSB1 bacterium]NIT70488.1 apolipoprotein N-acyltransferase [candidate division KSB1 bacterium]NIU24193.1 apolipoprotein N-acyltransferase [candidate division KSB1 bacterium]